jgi:large subunit ribosomal protein L3
MTKGLIGKKIGMTQIFDEAGKVVPVTVIEAGPCVVTQLKTAENDGYEAVQLGFGDVSPKHTNKPMTGHFKKNDLPFKRTLKEFRLDDISNVNVGDVLKADVFAAGDVIDVSGVSKGKGFQGRIKRWGQRRGPMTHGSHFQRHPGSIGQCAYPARVLKGVKMAGHMGNERVTVKNLSVVRIDAEQNLILVKGAVPGAKNGLVAIRMA